VIKIFSSQSLPKDLKDTMTILSSSQSTVNTQTLKPNTCGTTLPLNDKIYQIVNTPMAYPPQNSFNDYAFLSRMNERMNFAMNFKGIYPQSPFYPSSYLNQNNYHCLSNLRTSVPNIYGFPYNYNNCFY